MLERIIMRKPIIPVMPTISNLDFKRDRHTILYIKNDVPTVSLEYKGGE
jgi:hypothetical protein